MSTDDSIPEKLGVLKWAIGLLATLSVAAIPWAMTVQSDLASIRTKLHDLDNPPKWLENKVENNSIRIKYLEEELKKLEDEFLRR
jgi:hypothetical protein